MRRRLHFRFLLIPLVASLAFAACREPLAPDLGGLTVASWPVNPCSFFAQVPTSAALAPVTNGPDAMQLAECATL